MTTKDMKIKKTSKIVVLSISLFFLFTPVYTNAFGVSPLKVTQTIDPGEKVEITVSFTNDKDTATTIVPSIDSYKNDEKTGTAVFGQKSIAESWIVPAKEQIEIASGKTEDIVFALQVPQNAEPGSYFLGLFGTEKIGNNNEQITVSGRLGTLLFLYVGGDITESLVRTSFATNKSWFSAAPIQTTLVLKNNGNIHVSPKGIFTITNKNGEVIATQKINSTNRIITPGNVWSEIFVLQNVTTKDTGPLEIKTDLTYGLKQKRIVDSITVWYIPKKIMIATFAGIFSILLGIFGAIAYAKKHAK